MKYRFQRKHLSIPYFIFLVAFVVLPIFFIIFYAFTDAKGNFTFANFTGVFLNNGTFERSKLDVLINSLLYGFGTTIICLLIGYPVAMILANKKYNKNAVIVMMFIMPMWINFVIRTWATRDLLFWIGLPGGIYPEFATIVGLTMNFLPFVILPLYSTMLKMDKSQIEAAKDLGANERQTFFKVIIPMTMPGIISAALMVFMPTISSYVISDVMSDYTLILFGKYIDISFGQGLWNAGSVLALIMILLIGLSAMASRRFQKGGEARASIW